MKKPPKQRLKVYKEETQQRPQTEEQHEPHPQRVPTQSIKSTKVEGPYFINSFVSNQRKYTKEFLSLWIDNSSSSKATLFLGFQTVQKRHNGLALQTPFVFFPTKDPSHPKSVAFTVAGSTHCTPKREQSNSQRILALEQWRRM